MVRWCRSYASLDGKTVIVTGANTGTGYYAALDFAKRGAKVILACRNKEKAERASNKIIDATGNQNVLVRIIDLASFASVRAFAENINATEDRLDILVNNAGVLAVNIDNRKTEDNLELTMQTNYFSSFLLTILLLGAKVGEINPNKLDEFNEPHKAYFSSKLGNILFTQELARRLQGTGVTSYSLHPGHSATDLTKGYKGLSKFVLDLASKTVMKTPEEGAQTTIYTAVEKDIEIHNGKHFADCQLVSTYSSARDTELANLVWEATKVLLRLEPEGTKI